MATNKQRRETERQRLQRQLAERRQREAARKRFILITSVAGTLALIVVLVIVLAVTLGGGDDKPEAGGQSGGSSSAAPSSSEAEPCTTAGLPGIVKFQGVSVGNSTNLKKEPKVCSASSTTPTKLQVKDLVVGKGKAAALTSTVKVQYTGVIYKDGNLFDSSWQRGQAADFSLQQVVPGFTQGIGGNAKAGIKAMKVGGRRIIIVPSALGYGAQGNQSIPPNTPLVFVVDLVKVS